MPRWPFGEAETVGDLLDLRAGRDDRRERFLRVGGFEKEQAESK